jgi:hypothetical protein
MFSINHHRTLSRRALLRGAGVAISLPWLTAMEPALRRTSRAPAPTRAAFIFSPNGMRMDRWTPKGEGPGHALSPTLQPLQPWKRDLLVLSGLAIDGGRAHGDGPGDHARAAASFLTCAHPKKTGGADIQAGVSVDQVLAQSVGAATLFPSLELGMEGGRAAGVCDSGYSCAYSNNVSWRTESVPQAKEVRPREVFARLFGDPNDMASAEVRQARLRDRRSILDLALGDARRLGTHLGVEDRRKLTDYLDAVRELEKRLGRTEESSDHVPVPEGLDRGGSYEDRLALMYELMALAFQTDRTRVITFMLGNAGSNRSFRNLGVADGHHDISHHGKKPQNLEHLSKINRFQVENLARFLGRLQAMEEEGGTVLDHSLVLFGAGIGDGNAHNHDNLPILLAGRGGGVSSGTHVAFKKNTPMANLYVSLLQRMGVRTERFADSTGRLF